jgi:serine/threonine protein phosphatase PrpC/CRP-like cAMP-binding protein
MKIVCTAGTDVGKERSNNEDAHLVDEALGLYIVCDGMGGHQYGEIASANATEFIRDAVRQQSAELERFRAGELTTKDVRALLKSALEATNAKLREMVASDASLDGMGTTAVVVLINGNHAFLGHVGDSRMYLLRDDTVHPITEDHSIGSEVQKKTSLPREYRGALTRALGVHDSVEPDVLSFDLFPGDVLLLASDGLYTYFTPRKLRDIFAEQGPAATETVLRALIDGALERGGRDNITGILLYVDDDPAKKEYQIARRKLEIIQQLSLFRYLTFTELLHIMNLAHAERFETGAAIFTEGEDGESLFIILRGEVVIRKGTHELARLNDGSHFGEMALLEKGPRSATVTALRDTVCLVIDRTAFYDLLRDLPNLAVKVLWSFVKVLSTRLRETTDELSMARELLTQRQQPTDRAEPVGGDAEPSIAPPPLPNTATFLNMPAIDPNDLSKPEAKD